MMAWIDSDGKIRDEGNPMRYDPVVLANRLEALAERIEALEKENASLKAALSETCANPCIAHGNEGTSEGCYKCMTEIEGAREEVMRLREALKEAPCHKCRGSGHYAEDAYGPMPPEMYERDFSNLCLSCGGSGSALDAYQRKVKE